MKKLALIIILIQIFSNLFGQQKAITDTGDEVILFEDGTWVYQSEDLFKKNEIPVNEKKYKKEKNSNFLLKSNKLNIGFWLNPKEWAFKKAVENPVAEYELHLKKGDLYALVITEKIEIPLETLKGIALENGKSVAPDLKIVKEEYRNVNDTKVLLLQMDGTTQGIKVTYYGYYYSNYQGTVQFITYTSQNLFKELKEECERFLNGFVVI